MARPDCVSCGSTTRRGKLLRCFHALCVECVEKQTSEENSVLCPNCGKVTPPPSTGVSQLQSLPDSDVSTAGADGGQQQQQRKFCDECAEDTVAVATCSDCNDNFCAIHAQGHPVSRKTYKHKVVSLSDQAAAVSAATSSNTPTAANCPLHPSSRQSHYCLSCSKLLCDKCLTTKRHENHRHQVQPIQQAAAEVKKSLTAKMGASFIGRESVLEVALNKAETALSGLPEETESVSAQVTGFFDGLKKAIDKRQQELLDQLDSLRSARLLPLEQQKQRLLSGLSSGQKAKHLTETCCDDINLLKMAVWLEEATSDAISAADVEVKQFTRGTLIFTPCVQRELNTAIEQAGTVADVDMVFNDKSTMSCPATVLEGEELVVSIEARNATGDVLSVNQAHLSTLKVEVVSDDTTSTECPVTATTTTAATGTVVAKYKTTKTGQVTVSAKTRSDRHLRGSPTPVNIIDPLQFDPARRHADIRLSNGNRTATVVRTATSYRSVCGKLKWTGGKHEIAIRLDHVSPNNCHHMLFICNADQPRLDAYKRDRGTMFGWLGGDTSSGSRIWKGSFLGQPWQSGDVIHMSLDCDTHTLVGRHDRTGTTQTLTNVTGQHLYLYVSMQEPQDQVTIL